MNAKTLSACTSLATAGGIAGLVLPSLSQVYETPPQAPGKTGLQLKRGELALAGYMGILGTLYSMQSGNAVPLVFAGGMTILVIGFWNYSLAQRPAKAEQIPAKETEPPGYSLFRR